MAMIMMMPPMVGVPVFFICPSSPRSRIISPTWASWRRLMILRPIKIATISESTKAAPERKVM